MSRTAVLLLHGQPGSARDWNLVAAALGPRADPIAIARPGWDGLNRPSGLAGNAAAAVAALDACGIERATVVGHSFGGAVAAWLAAVHPDRVGALVLAAPSANMASLVWLDRWLAAPVAGYLIGAATLGALGAALAFGSRGSAHATNLRQDYLRPAGRLLRRPSAWRSFHVEQRALIRDLPALEDRLPRIGAPTTIVAGTADRIVPLASARLLAGQIPGAELVVVPGAGHLLPLRHAERLAESIVSAGSARVPVD